MYSQLDNKFNQVFGILKLNKLQIIQIKKYFPFKNSAIPLISRMYLQSAEEQLSYNQLVNEVRSKNKQIQFLQDKIVLMQRQKQTKITEIQSRCMLRIQQHIDTYNIIEGENKELRAKVDKLKMRNKDLSESYKQVTNQLSILTQSQSTLSKQQKSYKYRLQKQKKSSAQLQQQSIQLKSIVNILQKQVRELTCKNLKLLEEKNILMNTYNDYDQVKFKLQEIQQIYSSQYQSQVQLIRKRMKQELEANGVEVLKELNHEVGNRKPTETKQICSRENTLMNNQTNNNQMTFRNTQQQQKIRIESIPQNELNQKHQQNTSCSHYEHQQREISATQLKNTVKLSPNQITQPIFPNSTTQQCRNCLFQKSWSQDILKLKNIISNGQTYMASFDNLQGKENLPQFKGSSNKLFNHNQTTEIYDFIIQKIKTQIQLKKQVQAEIMEKSSLKGQFQSKISQLLAQVQELSQQQQQKQSLLEQLRKNQELQINNVKSQFQLQYQQVSNIQFQLNKNTKNLQNAKDLCQTLTLIISKFIQKYSLLREKYHLVNKGFFVFNTVPQKFIGSNQKNKQKTSLNQNQQRFTGKKLFRKAAFAVLFTQFLKKDSSKLRRKVLLHYGIKPPKAKYILSAQNQEENKSVESKTSSISGLSLHDIIFSKDSILFRQSDSSRNYVQNLLKRCVYQIRREAIVTPKWKISSENLEIQNYFKKSNGDEQNSSKMENNYVASMKMIQQQLFLSQKSVFFSQKSLF